MRDNTTLTPEHIQAQKKANTEAFYKELFANVNRLVPAKYNTDEFRISKLQPSEKSRLPLEEQAKLYDEIRANPLAGWAFFAPAGCSKTSCSYSLFKAAVSANMRQ